MEVHALVGDTADGVSDTRSIPAPDWNLFEQAIEHHPNLNRQDFDETIINTINPLRSCIYALKTKYFMLEQECLSRKQMVDGDIQTLKLLENILPQELAQKIEELWDIRELITQKIRHIMWLADKLPDQESRLFVITQAEEFKKTFNLSGDELKIDMGTHAGLTVSDYRPPYVVKGIEQFKHLDLPEYKWTIPREKAPIYSHQEILDSLNRQSNEDSTLPTNPDMYPKARF